MGTVNLLILGLLKTVRAPSPGADDRPRSEALARTLAAVEGSGLRHNELWSYRIENGRLLPERYRTSDDIQLWNLTDLAVEFMLDRYALAGTR